ncbi:hypothetical protein DFQ11_1058 [Winogradskyella epiphytica]|uniref:Uncharacterized protein n=1 Tax=Winogradskyella epiphytica TaxID=262005 RepID=A0A2V4XRA6_9FLAO|nr:hypothetical protein [Winogradskyella epiphytica]PYE80411.1 hypothetical protein DFQ11_1058 [Winogradskyella epiphytica]GGW69638.1 hypothetical protein GCM10008085_22050 [Winogradskyella epiphytica]
MKTKLHVGILVVLLAFIGTYVERNTLPNQQIVIQFSDSEVSSEDTEKAIKAIQTKLESVGVTHIQIGKKENGQLKIVYHSDTDVEHIQNVLFKTNNFKLAFQSQQDSSNQYPEHHRADDYKLNISEIKTDSGSDWGVEDAQIVEINQKTDRLSFPQSNNFSNTVSIQQTNCIYSIAILVNNTVAIAIDNHSYKIPEVRAGPTA